MACTEEFLQGGVGSGVLGALVCGAVGDTDVLAPSDGPTISDFSPGPGIALGRLQHITFEVSSLIELALIFVVASFPDGTSDAVYDGDTFAPRYGAGSSKVEVDCGFLFTIKRTGGWIGSPVRLEVTAVDAEGNIDKQTAEYP